MRQYPSGLTKELDVYVGAQFAACRPVTFTSCIYHHRRRRLTLVSYLRVRFPDK